MVRHKHIEEVVEDSEPEREELRRREKKERSGKRKRALEIIELTASESDTPAVSGDLSVDVPSKF
jgi:hypothetical protein